MISKKILKQSSYIIVCTWLCFTLMFSNNMYAFASSNKVYQYDINGRLTTIYTAKEKTTFTYDANGNLLNKKVEKGDYQSIVNGTDPSIPDKPVTPPQPEPKPPIVEPIPPKIDPPIPPDPTVVPPPVPVPNKQGLGVMAVIDTPYGDAQEPLTATGWYLDTVGVKKIEIYIDNKFMGNAVMGVSREDVYQGYPDYNNHLAGYQFNIGAVTTLGVPHKKRDNKTGKNKVVPGYFDHTIRVVFTNLRGEQREWTKDFVLNH